MAAKVSSFSAKNMIGHADRKRACPTRRKKRRVVHCGCVMQLNIVLCYNDLKIEERVLRNW